MPRQFSDNRTVHFLTQMAAANRAGLPITRTVKLLQQNEGPPALRRVWVEVERGIQAGTTFGEALAAQTPPVPALCTELIAAGEESGHLDLVLTQLRNYYDMRASLRRAVLGASAYPLFVAFFGFSVWTLLRVIVATDKAAAAYGMVGWFTLLLLVAGALVFFFARTPPGQMIWDGAIIRVPIVGRAVRQLALVRFARTLSMMYTSGIRIETALDRACSAAANRFVSADLRKGAQRVAQGERLGEAFAPCHYVPATMRELLHTGDLTGTYDETLQHIAELYEDEARQVLHNLPKLIAPIMLIVIGGLVVYLYYTYYILPYVIEPMNDLF